MDFPTPTKSLSECVADGTHLQECDDDGYCMECGEQEPYEGAWDEEDDEDDLR